MILFLKKDCSVFRETRVYWTCFQMGATGSEIGDPPYAVASSLSTQYTGVLFRVVLGGMMLLGITSRDKVHATPVVWYLVWLENLTALTSTIVQHCSCTNRSIYGLFLYTSFTCSLSTSPSCTSTSHVPVVSLYLSYNLAVLVTHTGLSIQVLWFLYKSCCLKSSLRIFVSAWYFVAFFVHRVGCLSAVNVGVD